MRALKALVIGMGVLIVVGLAVVVVTIAKRADDAKPEAASAERRMGTAPLAVPAGATVLETDLLETTSTAGASRFACVWRTGRWRSSSMISRAAGAPPTT